MLALGPVMPLLDGAIESAHSLPRRHKGCRQFMLTSLPAEERGVLSRKIRSLGGTVVEQQVNERKVVASSNEASRYCLCSVDAVFFSYDSSLAFVKDHWSGLLLVRRCTIRTHHTLSQAGQLAVKSSCQLARQVRMVYVGTMQSTECLWCGKVEYLPAVGAQAALLHHFMSFNNVSPMG